MTQAADTPEVPRAIQRAIAAVKPPDPAWADRRRTDVSTSGAFGRLIDLGRQLAAIQRTDLPSGRPALVAVFAADHGVALSGIDAGPSAPTGPLLAEIARGRSLINAMADAVDVPIEVVDLGVAQPRRYSERDRRPHTRTIRAGTSNFLEGPAMTREEAYRAVGDGLQLGSGWSGKNGYRTIVLGEAGTDNATTAAAVIAALTGASSEAVIGRSVGEPDAPLARQRAIVDRALGLHGPACRDLWDWLARIGGFEILGLAGLAIASARGGSLIVLDGLASTAAGLIASRLCPAIAGLMVASHLSPVPGHKIALDALGLTPLLELGIRRGEATGAMLCIPLIESAGAVFRTLPRIETEGGFDLIDPWEAHSS